MKVKLTRIDSDVEKDFTLDIEEDETPLGRGPLLQIDATNISRQKISLFLKEGQLHVKCLKNPPIIIERGESKIEEPVDKSKDPVKLQSGDVVKFDSHNFFFKVHYESENVQKSAMEDVQTTPDETTISPKKSIKGVTEVPESINSMASPSKSNFGKIMNKARSHDSPSSNKASPTKSNSGVTEPNPTSSTNESPSKSTAEHSVSPEPKKRENELEPELEKPTKKRRKLPQWMLDIDKENVTHTSPAKESKDTKGKCKNSPKKLTKVSKKEDLSSSNSSPMKEAVVNKSDATNFVDKIDAGVHKEPEIRDEDTITKEKLIPAVAEPIATSSNDEPQKKNFLDEKIKDVLQSNSLLMESQPEDSDIDQSKQDGNGGGGGIVYPVLINPSDLQDSDNDEPATKKKEKPKKKAPKKAGPPTRKKCPYGRNCYRKNPVHFQEESHPDDSDYDAAQDDTASAAGTDEEDDDRPECEFGTDCYRKNPVHKRDFKHTHKPQPKRKAKQKARKKKASKNEDSDEYESDFIDDDEIEEDIDDTDEDENWTPPDSEDD